MGASKQSAALAHELRDEVSPTQPRAVSFGREDFEQLWTRRLLGCGDEGLGRDLCALVDIRDAGVFLDTSDVGEHWADRPVLPFPFTPGELAAFMLDGPGYFLGMALGGLDRHVPDLTVRSGRRADDRQPEVLLAQAWAAFRVAVEAVGPRPVDLAEAAARTDEQWSAAKGVDQPELPNQAEQFGRRTVYEGPWLDAMRRQLMRPQQGGAELATPESTASAASPSHGGTNIRWTAMALAELVEHHAQHGTSAAAAHFGINVQRVGALLRKQRRAAAAPSPTAHVPFPPRKG